MLAPDWSWWGSVPVILAALALLWIPGTLLAAGLGAGRWPSIALAPVLTTALVAVGGIVCGAAGIHWGLGPLLVVGLGLPLVVLVVRLLLARVRPRGVWPRLGAPDVPVLEIVVGGGIAAVVAATTVVRGLAHPGDFPQQPDTIYHLGLVRYFLDSGSISSLTADGFNHPSMPSFYPAAFHGLAASLVLLTQAPVIIVVQSLLVVTAAVVWPLGLMFLMGALFPGNRPVVLVSGVLASAIPGFPFLVSVWGPLWPVEYGYALIPAVLAVVGLGLADVFGLSHGLGPAGTSGPSHGSGRVQRSGRRSWVSAGLLFLVALPGITLAHPSATYAAAAGGVALAAAACWRYAREPRRTEAEEPMERTGAEEPAGVEEPTGKTRRAAWNRWIPLGALVLAVVVGFLVSARVAPAGLRETSYDRVDPPAALIGLVSLWAPRPERYQIAGSAVLVLILLGAVATLVRRRGIWLLPVWGAFMVLGYLTSYQPGSLTWPFTWPWYNLPVRLQGVAAVFGVPLAALGVTWLLRLLSGRLRVLQAVVIIGVAVVAGVQIRSNASEIAKVTRFGGDYAWVNAGELSALREFSRVLPDDAVVAADPWMGGMFLYLVGPEDTVIHTEKSWGTDVDLMASGLDRVRADPAVCSAVRRERVAYVITGGTPHITAGDSTAAYVGIDDVAAAGGFRVVDRAGPYTLWAVPECPE
ncbi:DUF6541 family protein [Raineyella sp. W15-4]|uniref:DUF6541 family protein n=1 Tax=Raineyella sp. W15-4 TaxID=3081651 RepID=UPI00295582C1|nr:DUF6541 family protein [Raineyella sp. W15-4]WOQ16443.1 DUF6541 family protein [Raineyella sp. W15-4]